MCQRTEGEADNRGNEDLRRDDGRDLDLRRQEHAYRLEIRGRLHSAASDSVFVYLSNVPEISFERAAKAAGLSSNSDDYFAPEEAVLVEWN